MKNKISILFPAEIDATYKELSTEAFHDLGLDMIVKELSVKDAEVNIISQFLSKITADPAVSAFRIEVFNDIYQNKAMRDELIEILEKINFIKNFGSFKRDFNETSNVWDLLHRLEEINDYIKCVDALHNCLSQSCVTSKGLIGLRTYVEEIYNERGFDALKKDIANLKANTQSLKSVTLGVNLNEYFEAEEIGLISINSKSFTKSGIIENFHNKISGHDIINKDTEWNDDYKFDQFSAEEFSTRSLERVGITSMAMAHPMLVSMAHLPEGDSASETTRYMNRVTNKLLSSTVRNLRTVLNQYVTITITDVTNLIPEFIFYIRWAEYIESLVAKGFSFSKPEVKPISDETSTKFMQARGIYNFKLAAFDSEEHANIVTNDLDFNPENLIYILTGANRGGKTTITQAIGQLFVLAQCGLYIPGDSFRFSPVDNIFTHFPADEDKTMDLGRLGEECKRFKEIYSESTENSLLLLNETFSTTSFEEGYYIAKDSVKAVLSKGQRTIYNTHMHKLAFDIDEINAINGKGMARSLIVKAEAGARSYKVEVAPPVGQSFAKDIAEKYGVTYDMLTTNVAD